MQQIRALPEGEPFVIPENGVVTVGVITSERAEPVSPANARPLAVQALRNKQLAATIQERLKQSRAAAEIEYQPGFAPPADQAGDRKRAVSGKMVSVRVDIGGRLSFKKNQ